MLLYVAAKNKQELYITYIGVIEKAGNPIHVLWILVRSAQIWQCPVLLLLGNADSSPLAQRGQATNELSLSLPLPLIHRLLAETKWTKLKKKTGDHFVVNVRYTNACLHKCFLFGIPSPQVSLLMCCVDPSSGSSALFPSLPLQNQSSYAQFSYSFV